jgi:tetratricopeptide (TPR) repeat protein
MAQGRQADARDLLRAAARQNFAQADLFAAAAQAILSCTPDRQQADEAVHWARRAAQVTRFHDAGAVSQLAATYAAAGHIREAIETARQAREIAVAQGNDGLVAQLDGQMRDYEGALRPR